MIDPYHPRRYCVQYRETDLAFIGRLLEQCDPEYLGLSGGGSSLLHRDKFGVSRFDARRLVGQRRQPYRRLDATQWAARAACPREPSNYQPNLVGAGAMKSLMGLILVPGQP